jgi:putative (di)nucleoside polyphosphate hydrolase
MARAPGQYFRVGVGAVILDGRGRVLAFERAAIPGAWQLPQGGLEADETPGRAVWRELAEETGLGRRDLALLGRYPGLLAYELPSAARRAKTGRGQVQYWFFFRCRAPARLALRLGEEFRAWRWMAFPALVRGAVAFRRPVYEALRRHAAGLRRT